MCGMCGCAWHFANIDASCQAEMALAGRALWRAPAEYSQQTDPSLGPMAPDGGQKSPFPTGMTATLHRTCDLQETYIPFETYIPSDAETPARSPFTRRPLLPGRAHTASGRDSSLPTLWPCACGQLTCPTIPPPRPVPHDCPGTHGPRAPRDAGTDRTPPAWAPVPSLALGPAPGSRGPGSQGAVLAGGTHTQSNWTN
jgi:hypothetical protein